MHAKEGSCEALNIICSQRQLTACSRLIISCFVLLGS